MKHRRSDSRLNRGRTLDVSLDQDPRNADFRMQSVLSAIPSELASRRWPCEPRLDQGSNGACIGYGCAHWFAADPMPQKVDADTAITFYHGAQDNDVWPGSNYSGTTPTGLMRFLQKLGVIGTYRWIVTFDELVSTISLHGPVMIGSQWREGCFEPDRSGFIKFDGPSQGGHFLTIDEVNFEQGYIGFIQSWGSSHGQGGRVFMRFADVESMLGTGPSIVYPFEKALGKYAAQPAPIRWWQFWR